MKIVLILIFFLFGLVSMLAVGFLGNWSRKSIKQISIILGGVLIEVILLSFFIKNTSIIAMIDVFYGLTIMTVNAFGITNW